MNDSKLEEDRSRFDFWKAHTGCSVEDGLAGSKARRQEDQLGEYFRTSEKKQGQ